MASLAYKRPEIKFRDTTKGSAFTRMPTFVLFLLGCCVLLARGFLPSQESTDGRPDYTHASITQAAIYHATSDVIANVISPGKYNASDPDGTIRTFFGNEQILWIMLILLHV